MQLDLKQGSRPRILAILTIVIMAVFVVRLFYLQIIEHGYYVTQANLEQLKQLVIPAKRGEIYAMDDGTPVKIVLNQDVYTVFADPATVSNRKGVINLINRVAGANAEPDISGLLAQKGSRYAVLATKMSPQQAATIKDANLQGIGFQEGTQRVYPEGQLAAQTLGFVNDQGQGRYGIEQGMNKELSGTNGLLQSVTDVSDVPLTIGNNNIDKPAKNGTNIVMTIDQNVQAKAEEALAAGLKKSHATNGSVMVMDPQSGKILAMANLPTFDPSQYEKVQDISVFNNATISAPYEPGSDMKTLTMATGVDKGVVTPDSTYNNTDHIQVGDRVISNATLGQTGVITLQHALNYSLNTGFVTVAERLGDGQNINLQARDTMYDYFHNKFGLGQLTGIQLSGEEAGIILPPTDPNGGAVQYSNMAFGQGLDVTMVQVCAAFSSVINGGTYYSPTVLAGTMSDDGSIFTPQTSKPVRTSVIKPSTSDTMRNMIHVARDAFYASDDTSGYYVGGKTGTSQTLVDGQYVNNQTVGTYLGFGGNDGTSSGPKYVIMVQVSGKNMNLAGNTDAMPIFTDISNWMLNYLKLQPKG
jgi:cell division protein FtsI (penicillin-binding protein 3)